MAKSKKTSTPPKLPEKKGPTEAEVTASADEASRSAAPPREARDPKKEESPGVEETGGPPKGSFSASGDHVAPEAKPPEEPPPAPEAKPLPEGVSLRVGDHEVRETALAPGHMSSEGANKAWKAGTLEPLDCDGNPIPQGARVVASRHGHSHGHARSFTDEGLVRVELDGHYIDLKGCRHSVLTVRADRLRLAKGS